MTYLLLFFVGLLALDMFLEVRELRLHWWEASKGRVGIQTLRSLTGITDRDALAKQFGEPDLDFRFAVSAQQVRAARTWPRRFFHLLWIDTSLLAVTALVGTLGVLLESIELALLGICTAFLYRSLKRGYGVVLLIVSHRQRLEEGRAKLAAARGQAS